MRTFLSLTALTLAAEPSVAQNGFVGKTLKADYDVVFNACDAQRCAETGRERHNVQVYFSRDGKAYECTSGRNGTAIPVGRQVTLGPSKYSWTLSGGRATTTIATSLWSRSYHHVTPGGQCHIEVTAKPVEASVRSLIYRPAVTLHSCIIVDGHEQR